MIHDHTSAAGAFTVTARTARVDDELVSGPPARDFGIDGAPAQVPRSESEPVRACGRCQGERRLAEGSG